MTSFASIGAALSLVASVATYYVLYEVLGIQHAICFGGFGATSAPFIEVQVMKGVAYIFEASTLVDDIETQYQHVEVFHHPYVGNILAIDGSLQITSLDEHHYHEMMVHVPCAYLTDPKKALIIGGGDGGALMRILQYPSLTSALLVDIDMHTMRDISYQYFPHLADGFLDPRTKAIAYDGNQWVIEQLDDETNEGSYDFIVIDSTDYGSSEPLFTNVFYNNVKKLLRQKGSGRSVAVLNLDSPSWNREVLYAVQHQMAQLFTYSYVYQCQQPTYLGGHFSFLFVSDTVNPMTTKIDWDAWRGLNLSTGYYTPERHYGSFMLSRRVQETLTMSGRLHDIPKENFPI